MDCCHLNVAAGLFHCLQKRHADMWLAVIYTPSPSQKEFLYRVHKMVSKGASIPRQTDCGWWTRPGPERPDGNWHYPIPPQTWADLVCSVQLYHGEHLEMWVYVGYCMDLVLHDDAEALEGLWRHTMWYFPRAARGRALWPITLRPRRLVLLRLNPASSVKMNSWGCAALSMAKILCNKKNIFLQCYTDRTPITQIPV